MGYLIAGAGLEGLVLGFLVWWFKRDRDTWQAQALKTAGDVVAVQKADAEMQSREKGANDVHVELDETFEAKVVVPFFAAHPEHAGEWGTLVRAWAASATGPADPAVPPPAPASIPGASGR